MLSKTLLFVSLFYSSVCFHTSWIQDEWHHLETEVQSHLQSVVADRLSRLTSELDAHCYNGQKMFMKLFIVNETAIAYYNNRNLWDREECGVSVFDASDRVLRVWCHAKPDRMLMFPFTHSQPDQAIGGFGVLVLTTCLLFPAGEDYARLPLPSPLDFRQDSALKFLLFTLLTLVMLAIFAFVYSHRRPLHRFFNGLWTVYQDRRDWNTVNEIVKFREQRIREEQERQREFVQTTVL